VSKKRRPEREAGFSTAGPARLVRHYELDGPQGAFVRDMRIGMVSRDVRSVLDGGSELERLNRTYRLVAAIGERIIARHLGTSGDG